MGRASASAARELAYPYSGLFVSSGMFSILLVLLAAYHVADGCHGPPDRGNGTGLEERFYYDASRRCCFSFKYSGAGGNFNNFASEQGCHRCLPMDVGMCDVFPGNNTVQGKTKKESDADTACGKGHLGEEQYCPQGYQCKYYWPGFYNCVNSTIAQMQKAGFSDKCPDGSTARGTFGKTCDEMFCGAEENCQQINPYFAKCCKSNQLKAEAKHPKPTI